MKESVRPAETFQFKLNGTVVDSAPKPPSGTRDAKFPRVTPKKFPQAPSAEETVAIAEELKPAVAKSEQLDRESSIDPDFPKETRPFDWDISQTGNGKLYAKYNTYVFEGSPKEFAANLRASNSLGV